VGLIALALIAPEPHQARCRARLKTPCLLLLGDGDSREERFLGRRFMNWALIDTGSFDYARGCLDYTHGAAAEWYQGWWTLRGGFFDISTVPNSTDLDTTFKQFQLDGEIERRYKLWDRADKIALTGFLTRASEACGPLASCASAGCELFSDASTGSAIGPNQGRASRGPRNLQRKPPLARLRRDTGCGAPHRTPVRRSHRRVPR